MGAKEVNDYGGLNYKRYRIQKKISILQREVWFNSGAVTKEDLEKDIILELIKAIPLNELKSILYFEVLEPFDKNIEKAWQEGDDFKVSKLLRLKDEGDIEYNLEIKIPQ